MGKREEIRKTEPNQKGSVGHATKIAFYPADKKSLRESIAYKGWS